jgi:RNA-directed DNA polymerase
MGRKRKTKMKALFWLSSKIIRNPVSLNQILKNILAGKKVYKERVTISKSGKKRKIHEPVQYLKEIQKLISKKLLTGARVSENAFGFSKGSVINAIEPHLGSRIILMLDIKNAFPSVNRRMVFRLMRSHRKGLSFSWYVSEMLCWLTLHLGRLPQGAPTSPKIFDLFCSRMDARLTKLAKNVEGNYSRYADNIFFSMGGQQIKDGNPASIPP